MKRQGRDFGDYDRPHGGKGPPRSGRPTRSFDGPPSYNAGRREGGPPPWRERSERDDDRPARSTFRREGGSQGGYGAPRGGRDSGPSRGGSSFGGRDSGAPRGGSSFGGRDRDRDSGSSFERSASPSPKPRFVAPTVSASKLKEGIPSANRALAQIVEQFGSSIEGDYDISTLEVAVSFGEDGKFIGFGRGGAVTMTLSLSPLSAEDILLGDEEEGQEGGDFEDDGDDDLKALLGSDDDEDDSDDDMSLAGDDEIEAPKKSEGKARGKKAKEVDPQFDA